MLFLLTLHDVEKTDTIHGLPEVTLWNTMNEAMAAAMHQAILDGRKINFGGEATADEDSLCIPGFCDILPITTSRLNAVTWFGKVRDHQALLSKRVD